MWCSGTLPISCNGASPRIRRRGIRAFICTERQRRMATQSSAAQPNPNRVFEAFNAYQNTAAMGAAMELDLFTAIGEGSDTVSSLVNRCRCTARGIRILCDYLTVIGFLAKSDGRYALGPDAAALLDRRSPRFQGSSSGFLTLPVTVAAFMNLTETIRTGRTAMADGEGSISPENPIWIEFARDRKSVV